MKRDITEILQLRSQTAGLLCFLTFFVVTSNMRIRESIGFLIVLFIFAVPGVVVANSMFRWTNDYILTSLLGFPFGMILSVMSQQLLVAMTGFTMGWIFPAIVTLPMLLRGRIRSRVLRSSDIENLAVCAVVASLALGDLNWAFMISGATVFLFLMFRHRVAQICVITGALIVRHLVDDKWFLVSNDRLFEEAYSRSIFHFGFWSWYGGSDTFIPYHWFAHAMAGIFQSQMGDEPFVAVGVGVAIVSSIVLGAGVVGLLRWVKLSDRQLILASAVTPLLGIYLLGESNSADLSVCLAVWLIALVFHLTVGDAKWWRHVLIGTGVIAVVLAKVSTGLVVGLSLTGMYLALSITGLWRKRFLPEAGTCFVATTLTVALNYGLLLPRDDSRAGVEFKVGGALAFGDLPVAVRFVISIVVIAVALFLPVSLWMRLKRGNQEVFSFVILGSVLVSLGWIARLFLLTYNNESFLEAAVLCAAPLLLLVVVANSREMSRLLSVGSVAIGVFLGFVQELFAHTSITGVRGGLLRLAGIGLFPFAVVIVVLLVVLICQSRKSTRPHIRSTAVTVSLLVLMSTWTGGDSYRFARQIQNGTVWGQTNFGMSDSFFFGGFDEQRVADWVRRNTASEAVLATNHLCPVGIDCALAGESPIAAWSQRRTYIEAERFVVGRRVNEIPIGANEVVGHPVWINRRKELSLRFSNNQHPSIQADLLDAGVQWFWLDLAQRGARVTRPELIAYRSGAIVLLHLEQS